MKKKTKNHEEKVKLGEIIDRGVKKELYLSLSLPEEGHLTIALEKHNLTGESSSSFDFIFDSASPVGKGETTKRFNRWKKALIMIREAMKNK